MKILIIIAVLFIQFSFAQSEELSDTVWTKFTYPNAINAVKFTPDGKYLASGGDDGVPRLWDAETGELFFSFPNQNYTITDIDIVNNLIAVASPVDGGVFVYDLINYQRQFQMEPSTNVTFSSDGKLLATTRGNTVTSSGISLYNTENGELIKRIDIIRGAYDLKFSRDNRYIVRASHYSDIDGENKEGKIDIFGIPDLNYVGTIERKEYLACHQLSFSPNNEYLAAAIEGGPNKIWNTSDWKLFKEFGGNGYSVAFSPDSKYVVTGEGTWGNRHIFIRNAQTGDLIYTYPRTNVPNSIDVSPDNRFIAASLMTSGIIVYNAKWNPTSVQENPVQIIEPLVFPNPTNSTANIRFELMAPTSINIQIYDINSRLITHIFDGFLDAGNHNFEWNTAQAPSGSYFARITANGSISTIKIIVNK